MPVSRLFCFLLLIASPTLPGVVVVGVVQAILPRGGGSDVPIRPATTAQLASWASSYATVDPSTILSILVQKAGFLLMDAKLRSLADLMHCEEAKLNVINRELLVRNFTVSNPADQQQPSLRIGRIYVKWDSYSQPCLELEVEDVDVLVEFTNLILTRKNWYVRTFVLDELIF